MKSLSLGLLCFVFMFQGKASSFEYSHDCKSWSTKNISSMDQSFYMRTDKSLVSLVDPKKEMLATGFTSEKYGHTLISFSILKVILVFQ